MKKSAAKKASKVKRPPELDMNQLAHHQIRMQTEAVPGPVAIVETPPSRSEISRVMAELGRRGGRIGGKARANGLSPERRREIALKAARKRWDK
ncbi:MAG: histone H1 [Bryobacteraceae bacterium]